MTVEHRFECVLCGNRVHATGEDSASARQTAREEAYDHLTDAHGDRLAATPRWPDDLSADDLLAGETAYGSLRGLLVPVDDLLACADCGYYFDSEGSTSDRAPVGDSGLICTRCYDRRVDDRAETVAEAIEAFVR